MEDQEDSLIGYMQPNTIPPVKVTCANDEWENAIRKFGVSNACEWFGHEYNSDWAEETMHILLERTTS